jgi:hypothetical protein
LIFVVLTQTGGVIYIIMFDQLIHRAGFPWTIRAIGFVALACALLSFPALLSGTSILARPRKRRALFDASAVKDKLFLLFTLCTFCNFLGYIVPYFYIPTFAQEKLGSSSSVSLYMLIGALGGSFFGRIGSGLLAHYFGSIVTWGLCALTSGILSLCWISIETQASFIAFSVFWGECTFPRYIVPYLLTVRRISVRRARNASFCCIRKHLPGYVTAWDSSWHVVERVQHCYVDRIANSWCVTEDQSERRNGFFGRAALVGDMSLGGVRMLGCVVGCYKEDDEHRMADLISVM